MEHGSVPIEDVPEYRRHLQHLVQSHEALSQAGYILRPLPPSAIERKKRCRRCHRVLGKGKPFPQRASPSNSEAQKAEEPTPGTITVAVKSTGTGTGTGSTGQDQEVSKLPCRFHPGVVSNRAWTCCRGPPFSKPCQGEKQHEPLHYEVGVLEKEWKYYPTPLMPVRSNAPVAVVIDCEMGTAQSGESELIRVSVIDYFSGSVLLDRLVYPHVRMSHFNTAFSGVTRKMMEDARRSNTCLFGRNKARAAVYEVVGPNTIVVGHGSQADLSSLRWMHPLVIDTLMVEKDKRAKELEEAEAERLAKNEGKDEEEQEGAPEPAQTGGLSLKYLARERLNRVIQIKGRGHDSVEDALATRDLLHWHISQRLAAGEAPTGENMAEIISAAGSGRW